MTDNSENSRKTGFVAAASSAAAGVAMLAAGFYAGCHYNDAAGVRGKTESLESRLRTVDEALDLETSFRRTADRPSVAVADAGWQERAGSDLDRLDQEILDLRLRIELMEMKKAILEASEAAAESETADEEPFGMVDRDLVGFRT